MLVHFYRPEGVSLTDLIFDIEKLVNDFSLKSVKLFIPNTYTLYSLAAASALSAYLNKVCQIPTTLVANQENVQKVSMCLPLTEDPNSIPKNANNFLAILLDCGTVDMCENRSYNKTFCALQVRGMVNMKSFGLEAYNDSDALCAAEVIFDSIQAHSAIYFQYCQEAYDYLYLAMLDATSVMKLHMKTKTFETIQKIIECGAELNIKPECFLKKDSEEIKVLERIYTEYRNEDQVCWVIMNEEQWNKIHSDCYQKVLEYIRFIKPFYCWAIFVKKKDDIYTLYGQGNATGKFDLMKTLKKYENLSGTKKKTKCLVKEDQIEPTINLLKEMVEKSKAKEKPRKKYTHKDPNWKPKAEREKLN